MKKSTINFALIVFAAVVMAASIWGPEMLTGYRDRTVLDTATGLEEVRSFLFYPSA